MDANEDLAWRVEAACMNALPAPRQVLVDGWVARVAGGPTRRTNSLNPLRGFSPDLGPVLDAGRAIYAAAGQPLIVRCPAVAQGLAASLDVRRWVAFDESCTMLADLEGRPAAVDLAVRLGSAADEDWLAARSRLNGGDRQADRTFARMTRCLALPRCFAAGTDEEGVASIAYGVVDRGLLVVNAVATDPRARGRGWARRTVSGLMAWAARAGAERACLQVLAANAPARALYDGLGFRTELHRYHYRQAADAA